MPASAPLLRVALLLALLLGLPALANPYLQRARRLYSNLDFPGARAQLELARQVPSQDRAERIEVLDLLARCHVAEGSRNEAEQVFAEVLALDPHFEPERGISPKIREAFDSAKARVFTPGYVRLHPLPAPTGLARAELVDPWRRVQALVWRRRPRGEASWSEQPLTPERGVVILDFGQTEQQWYLEARAADGSVVAQLGSEHEPLTFAPVTPAALEAPPPAPEVRADAGWQRTGAWGATGVAILAGATGAYLQATSIQSAQAARDEPWSDSARQLHARAVSQASWATGLFIGAGAAGAAAVVLFLW